MRNTANDSPVALGHPPLGSGGSAVVQPGSFGVFPPRTPGSVDQASVKLAQDLEKIGDRSKYHAYAILEQAAQTIGNRAAERDLKEERSMKSCVDAFNGLYGTNLTEEQGWGFMIFLKLARAKGKVTFDSYLDAVSYCALMAESAMKNAE